MSRSRIVSHDQTTINTSNRLVAAFVATLLGSFLVIGVGLSNAETLHNAAHDTRHALTFPCH